jgi:hypothetical protein
MFRLLIVLLTLTGVAGVLLLSLRSGEPRLPTRPVPRKSSAARPVPPSGVASEEKPSRTLLAPPEERLEAHVAAIPDRRDWKGSRAAARTIALDLAADPAIRSLVLPRILRLERSGNRHALEVLISAAGLVPDADLTLGLLGLFHRLELENRHFVLQAMAQDRHGSGPAREGWHLSDPIYVMCSAIEEPDVRNAFHRLAVGLLDAPDRKTRELGDIALRVLSYSQLLDPSITDLVLSRATHDEDLGGSSIIGALSFAHTPESMQPLRDAVLVHDDAVVVTRCANELARWGDREDLERLVTRSRDTSLDTDVRGWLLEIFERVPDPSVETAVRLLLSRFEGEDDPEIISRIVGAAGELAARPDGAKAANIVLEVLRRRSGAVRGQALDAIRRTGKAPGVPAGPLSRALWAAASDAGESPDTRVAALEIWAEAVPDNEIPAARRALRRFGTSGLPEELRIAVSDAEEILRDRVRAED